MGSLEASYRVKTGSKLIIRVYTLHTVFRGSRWKGSCFYCPARKDMVERGGVSSWRAEQIYTPQPSDYPKTYLASSGEDY